jgi:hypothetical protein
MFFDTNDYEDAAIDNDQNETVTRAILQFMEDGWHANLHGFQEMNLNQVCI